jgi:hypothetical protein
LRKKRCGDSHVAECEGAEEVNEADSDVEEKGHDSGGDDGGCGPD